MQTSISCTSGLLFLLACSGPEEADPAAHPGADPKQRTTPPAVLVHLTAGTDGVEVGAGPTGAEPAVPAASVPVASTIVFKNMDPEHFLCLVVEGDFSTSARCETVIDFEIEAGRAVSPTLPPQGVAAICFHRPGRHTFRASGGTAPLIGFIEVLESPVKKDEVP